MMNTTKSRRRAALAALVLALALLAGCAGEKAPDPAPEQSQAAEPAAVPAPEPAAEPDSSPEPAETPELAETPESAAESALSPKLTEESAEAPEPAKTPDPVETPEPAPVPAPAPQGPEDGNYTAAVALAGGSGRASIQSPAALRCAGGQFYASIVWSSPNFDYMKVDGARYELVSAPGENSAFEIPVAAFDRALPVIADTVAMSEPHEVEYTLTFDSASLVRQ